LTQATDQPLLARWPNFRDIGGVAAAGGRRVRQGRFFRSPALSDLRPAEEKLLLKLDPGLIVDFRSVAEISETAGDLPGALVERRVHLAIPPLVNERYRALFASERMCHEAVAEEMVESYRDFARQYHDTFARFLAATHDAGDRAVIFHCTAGKDRTGFAAALLLAALGAPSDEVERDYLDTAKHWRPDAALEAVLPEPARKAVFGVARGYLRAALDELTAVHGGPARFAEAALGGASAYRDWMARNTVRPATGETEADET
jgi:protein-tyrosine phosphatase